MDNNQTKFVVQKYNAAKLHYDFKCKDTKEEDEGEDEARSWNKRL